jgi:hypothetical protein
MPERHLAVRQRPRVLRQGSPGMFGQRGVPPYVRENAMICVILRP